MGVVTVPGPWVGIAPDGQGGVGPKTGLATDRHYWLPIDGDDLAGFRAMLRRQPCRCFTDRVRAGARFVQQIDATAGALCNNGCTFGCQGIRQGGQGSAHHPGGHDLLRDAPQDVVQDLPSAKTCSDTGGLGMMFRDVERDPAGADDIVLGVTKRGYGKRQACQAAVISFHPDSARTNRLGRSKRIGGGFFGRVREQQFGWLAHQRAGRPPEDLVGHHERESALIVCFERQISGEANHVLPALPAVEQLASDQFGSGAGAGRIRGRDNERVGHAWLVLTTQGNASTPWKG